MFIRLSRYAEVRDINLLIILMEHDGDAMRKANGEPAGHGGALPMRAVIATHGVHLLLSDAFMVKETKRCAIKRTKVGGGKRRTGGDAAYACGHACQTPGPNGPGATVAKARFPTTSRSL